MTISEMQFHAGRRTFLKGTAGAFAALMASGCATRAAMGTAAAGAYGPLVEDPAGLLDLPRGFTYRAVSRLGDAMDDGFTVPDYGDGMGCFDLGNGQLALVRNHELRPHQDGGGVQGPAYDTVARSLVPLPGGTTTIVLDAETLAVVKQYRSLAGTIRNCAGGITPWGSWLTCEENTDRANGRINKDHGYVFEVPADAPGLVEPVPIKPMGRFNHEAACVDPVTGIVYMTEDRDDGVVYRYVPKVPGKLLEGGRLQAMVLPAGTGDVRNWNGTAIAVGGALAVNWVDLEDPESPEDDLRKQAAAKGATVFARGEGLHMGEDELYFCCTSGGAAKLGQIFRLVPGRGGADRLELFFESSSVEQFNYGDNLCVAPGGSLVVCEDQYTDMVDNHLRWISPLGEASVLGRLRIQTELAGACFSPDGRTLFVNAFSPTTTLAIRGPWIG